MTQELTQTGICRQFPNLKFIVVVTVAVISTLGIFPTPAAAQLKVPESRAELTLSFSPIVKRVAPAVVNVYSKQIVRRKSRSPFFNDPFFRRFFGNGRGFGGPRERVSNSLGSGAIVSADGIVVTNHHVIKGGTEIRVALSDKREFEAKILLTDERTDLAVLKIIDGGQVFPFLEFSNSDAVEIGDIVLAVGNPFGIGQTVTSGIVSALARTQVGVADYRFFIQTDAAINPGNSGGPLIDMAGRVIGVNTAIFSRSGGSNGIGFAIPSNMARIVVTSAQSGKTVRRPWIGAKFQKLTPDLAAGLGLDRPVGALVTEIFPGGPFDEAGLAPGDVVLKLDDFDIGDPQGLNYRLTTRGIGGDATLTFLHDQARKKAQVALVVAPETPPRNELVLNRRGSLTGAKIANLSPAVAEELGVGYATPQAIVIITGIEPGSPAARVGLKVGDLMLGIDGQRVNTVSGVERELSYVGDVFELTIRRGRKVISTRLRG